MTGSKSGSDPVGRRRAARVRLAGLAAAAIVALLLILAGSERTGRPLFDLYQRLTPRDLSGTAVHVVLIDPDSISLYGPWPWSRYHLARLTEEIAARGAKAIGFDVLFSEPDRVSPDIFAGLYRELSPAAAAEVRRLPRFDRMFGEVIGRNPVVLGRAGVREAPRRSTQGELLVEAQFDQPLPPGVADHPHAIVNVPDLEDVAAGHGLLNAPTDSDGAIRRVPLVARVAGQAMPSLSLELARLSLDTEEIGLIAAGGQLTGVRLGTHTIPADADGRMRLRLGEFPATERSLAHELLRDITPYGAFRDKIVLIGPSAEGTSDIAATPLGETFGVLVQAQAVDAILRRGWLARPRWAQAVEWAAGAALVLLILATSPLKTRRMIALPLGLAAGIAAASWIAFSEAGLLLDPGRPLLLGAAAATGVLAMSFRNARVERERLREELLREQLSAAEAAGELQAARDIQRGMLPPREKLASLDPRLDIDALLEPARSVGGDFYDAMRLSKDRIGFVIGDVTGKGVPASLFMAVSKALAKSVMLREDDDLAGAAAMLDRELARDNEAGMAVTMVIGVIDLATGAATLVNAGHENPVLVSGGTASDLPMEGGPPFCVVDNYRYPVERIRLAPGEALVLVTDGVTEAQDAGGAFYGRARTSETLSGEAASAGEVIERLLKRVRTFEAGTDPSDDLTVLAVRYRGPS